MKDSNRFSNDDVQQSNFLIQPHNHTNHKTDENIPFTSISADDNNQENVSISCLHRKENYLLMVNSSGFDSRLAQQQQRQQQKDDEFIYPPRNSRSNSSHRKPSTILYDDMESDSDFFESSHKSIEPFKNGFLSASVTSSTAYNQSNLENTQQETNRTRSSRLLDSLTEQQQEQGLDNTNSSSKPRGRIIQNRKAQRAFRERRENHLKELELKTSCLPTTLTELEQLKSKIQTLEKELFQMKKLKDQWTTSKSQFQSDSLEYWNKSNQLQKQADRLLSTEKFILMQLSKHFGQDTL